MNLFPWFTALAATMSFGIVGWLVSLYMRNVSIVDSLWSIMIAVSAITFMTQTDVATPRAYLVSVLLLVWSVRLAAYITWRNWGEGEDFRYQQIRRNNSPHFQLKSVYIVFGLQAVLAWFISLPVLAATTEPTPLGLLDYAGATLWLLGFLFESVGDWQLAKFKANPDNKGKVLAGGLWQFTRHPNYFGDFCIWWGFYLIALSAGAGWTIASPLLMSFLLLKVSGVAMLERDIADRRPEYKQYIETTNAFFPGTPVAPANNAPLEQQE